VFGLLRRPHYERTGFQLYGAAVAAAREPFHYAVLQVPDTLDGRFDLVGLHTCIVIRRLRLMPKPGPELAQAVFDAMFSDMDVNLRELGVSDLSVGKRVRAMWEAFHGRALAYESALAATDIVALADALRRNVWRGEPPEGGSPGRLAQIAVAQDTYVCSQDNATLAQGRLAFLSPSEVDFA
jgi:cytochrome b pre-mRNA-processing protein 3